MRTRVKICGLTQACDAQAAVAAGADAIGLVFYGRSPRSVDTARARAVRARSNASLCRALIITSSMSARTPPLQTANRARP